MRPTRRSSIGARTKAGRRKVPRDDGGGEESIGLRHRSLRLGALPKGPRGGSDSGGTASTTRRRRRPAHSRNHSPEGNMRSRLRDSTVDRWAVTFRSTLGGPSPRSRPRPTSASAGLRARRIRAGWRSISRRPPAATCPPSARPVCAWAARCPTWNSAADRAAL